MVALLNDDGGREPEKRLRDVMDLCDTRIKETERNILSGTLSHDKYKEQVAVLTALREFKESAIHLSRER